LTEQSDWNQSIDVYFQFARQYKIYKIYIKMNVQLTATMIVKMMAAFMMAAAEKYAALRESLHFYSSALELNNSCARYMK